MFSDLAKREPIYAPKQKSTYSNLNYVLLGFVIEKVTGISYSDYIDASILQPLGMAMSSFTKPNDTVAVLPKLPKNEFGWSNWWDIEEGINRP
jgi:CubicO group peptidase (beta-lactamase class C family)